MAERPNVVQQKLRLIELMRENAWMVDKSDPKYKNRDKKAEKWKEIAAILGEEGDLICPDSKGQMNWYFNNMQAFDRFLTSPCS